jgi:hypothetical protein
MRFSNNAPHVARHRYSGSHWRNKAAHGSRPPSAPSARTCRRTRRAQLAGRRVSSPFLPISRVAATWGGSAHCRIAQAQSEPGLCGQQSRIFGSGRRYECNMSAIPNPARLECARVHGRSSPELDLSIRGNRAHLARATQLLEEELFVSSITSGSRTGNPRRGRPRRACR